MSVYRTLKRPWRKERQYAAQPAVHWLAPSELVNAGVRAVVSKTFGDYSDRRETFAILEPHARSDEDHPLEREGYFIEGAAHSAGDYWFDYVSDVGDGFNATYAVAEHLAADSVAVEGAPELHRGEFLVMGGDEVYPTPSAADYLKRTVGPYETALQYLCTSDHMEECVHEPAKAHVYAVPGNHDWYDGLSAFLKQFCNQEWIGAWQTRQHRSYFAIKLPRNWWLWGIDTAFEGPMDGPQLAYFEAASHHLDQDDRVILCAAKPTWLECAPAEGNVLNDGSYGNIRKVVTSSGARVRLMLAGDKHYYARYTESLGPAVTDDGEAAHKIVAGGGGAYLSITGALHPKIRVRESEGAPPDVFALAGMWPTTPAARRLGWTSLWRLPRTWSFALLLGALYVFIAFLYRQAVDGLVTEQITGGTSLTGAGLASTIRTLGDQGIGGVLSDLWTEGLSYAPLWVTALVMWAAFSALSNKKLHEGKWLGWLLGGMHTAAHLAAAWLTVGLATWVAASHMGYAVVVAGAALAIVLAYWLYEWRAAGTSWTAVNKVPIALVVLFAAYWVLVATGDSTSSVRLVTTFVVTLIVVGSLAATLIFALFLIASVYLGRNHNELAIGIRWEGYKNFLRMRIDEAGDLHVYALGLKKVPGRDLAWQEGLPVVSGEPARLELIDSVKIAREPHVRPQH